MPQTIILIASSLVKAPPFEQYRVFFAIRMRSAGMLCGTIWDFVAASAAGRVAIIIFRTTPFIAAIFFLVRLQAFLQAFHILPNRIFFCIQLLLSYLPTTPTAAYQPHTLPGRAPRLLGCIC